MWELTLVGLIVLFFLHFGLKSRVSKLEEELKKRGTDAVPVASDVAQSAASRLQVPPQTAGPVPQPGFMNVVQAVAAMKEPVASSASPSWDVQFSAWLKEDWLLKLGALLFLIGFGWLVSYAFLHNWIGPVGRITIGLIAGALILIFGWWRMRTFVHQGGVFMVIGSAAVLLTVFAAREIYQFFTPTIALSVMFLTSAFVAFASVQFKSRNLALGSLIVAGVAPLLTNSPAPDYIGLFAYLLVVVVGAVWIVALTGQRALTLAALVIVALYSMPHLFGILSADTSILLLFAYAFGAIFFITNILGILRNKEKDSADTICAVGNGLFLLTWIMMVAPEEWQSLIISAWMVAFLTAAFVAYRATQRPDAFYTYAGVAVAMIAAATAAELEGAALTIAYTIESGLIPLISYAVLKDFRLASRTSLLLIGPAFLALPSIVSSSWNVGVVQKNFFVLLILSATLFLLGLFFSRLQPEVQTNDKATLSSTLLVAGSVFAYILLWLSMRAALDNNTVAVMICLIIYTIIGLIAYFYGRTNDKGNIRIYGGVLLAFVVVRLLLIDVWNMELTWRIITFFAVGALLMSTAFFGRHKSAPLAKSS
ncbi:MAG: DUF2339 domain-containing protein [bacterium]|nr:DUF2339 domain-containing protein [bacterium]